MASQRVSKRTTTIAGLSFIAATCLAACGGGGGSSGGGVPPSGVSTGGVTATASPTPSPSPSPTATPTSAPQSTTRIVVTGADTNAPLAGAIVSVGAAFNFVPGGAIVATQTATTATDGSVTLTGTLPTYIEVDANGYASLHRYAPTTGTATSYALNKASSDEAAGLAELNKHRAALGSGNGALPITLDSDLLYIARARTLDMATKGYFAHSAPGASFAADDSLLMAISGGLYQPYNPPIFLQENIGCGSISTLTQANDGYIALGAADGHYQNIVSKTDVWVGLGDSLGGIGDGVSCKGTTNYFAENYFTTTANPSP